MFQTFSSGHFSKGRFSKFPPWWKWLELASFFCLQSEWEVEVGEKKQEKKKRQKTFPSLCFFFLKKKKKDDLFPLLECMEKEGHILSC